MKYEVYTFATWIRTAHGKLLLQLEKASNNCVIYIYIWFLTTLCAEISKYQSGEHDQAGAKASWWRKVGNHPVTPKGRLAFVNKETAQCLQYFSCLDIILRLFSSWDNYFNLNSILMPIAKPPGYIRVMGLCSTLNSIYFSTCYDFENSFSCTNEFKWFPNFSILIIPELYTARAAFVDPLSHIWASDAK